jgi:PAS domain S-box-containing protein
MPHNIASLSFSRNVRSGIRRPLSLVLAVLGFLAVSLSLIFLYYGYFQPEQYRSLNMHWHVSSFLFALDWLLIVLLFANLAGLRRRTRQALQDVGETREMRNFLDSVIEHIPNMIFLKDAKDLKFVRLNQAGEVLLGHPREELIGKSDYDFFPEEQADFFTRKDREVLEGKGAVDIPDEPIKTTHGMKYLHTKKIPIFDAEGKPLYLLGISEDITEKKQAEQQKISLLKEQAARVEMERSVRYLSFLSKASAVMTESLDIDTMIKSIAHFVATNLADMCMIDLINEQGDGVQRFSVIYRDPRKQEKPEEFRSKFTWDESRHRSLSVLHSGKSELYGEMNDEFIKRVVGREEQFRVIKDLGMQSGVAVPIKFYKKIIGSMTLFSAEAGHRYDEYDLSVVEDLAKRISFAIENARLYAKAQSASQAKSDFLANMSHEIRTPLSAMLGFAEVLNGEENLSMEQREYVSIIARNGRQLVRIVDEILDLAKIESDTIRVENIAFQPRQLIDEVATLLKGEAEKKDLQFSLKYLSPMPKMMSTDPTRLRQILTNIVGNAIKFTDHGAVEISVQLKNSRLNPHKKILHIEVKDSGIGISPEQRKKIFQPFVQADSSTKRLYGGTGLGLFLSKRLAKLLGGDLILGQSGVGRGSTFVFTAEVEVPEMEKSLVPKMDLEKGKKEPLRGRVLIVDDVLDNRKLVSYHVARLGFEVDQADSGAKGIEKALANDYDVILMDVQMPEMDGFEVVRYLRGRNYKRPIIALTAYAMKGDKEKCLKAGFDDYIGKPIETKLLHRILERYGRKKKVRPSSEATA